MEKNVSFMYLRIPIRLYDSFVTPCKQAITLLVHRNVELTSKPTSKSVALTMTQFLA